MYINQEKIAKKNLRQLFSDKNEYKTFITDQKFCEIWDILRFNLSQDNQEKNIAMNALRSFIEENIDKTKLYIGKTSKNIV